MLSRFTFACLLLLSFNIAFAQVNGGRTPFQMLRLNPSARIIALGGIQLAVLDDDINLATANPAALQGSMHGRFGYQHLLYYADINGGQFAYAHQLKSKKITLGGGMQFMSYGDMPRADVYGNIDGRFKAGEQAYWVGGGMELYEHMRVGARVRMASSTLDTYRSTALMADLSATWFDTTKRIVATFAILNAGTILRTYTPGDEATLPFEIQAGISKRLKYLPFRFSVHAQHLQRWNLRYDDPNSDENVGLGFGETPSESRFQVVSDNLFRHLVFGGEFLLGPKELFRLRFGYNHLRRKELSVASYRSLAGFSAGVGLRLSKFRLDYGLAFYHIAGPVHSIGISTALSEFAKPQVAN